MPIEIKELHIRVAVDAEQGGDAAPAGPRRAAGAAPAAAEEKKEALLAECIEQVMQIIDNKSER